MKAPSGDYADLTPPPLPPDTTTTAALMQPPRPHEAPPAPIITLTEHSPLSHFLPQWESHFVFLLPLLKSGVGVPLLLHAPPLLLFLLLLLSVPLLSSDATGIKDLIQSAGDIGAVSSDDHKRKHDGMLLNCSFYHPSVNQRFSPKCKYWSWCPNVG